MLYKVSSEVIYDISNQHFYPKTLITIPKCWSLNIVGPFKFNFSYIGYAAYSSFKDLRSYLDLYC